jgi:hypothetical protein
MVPLKNQEDNMKTRKTIEKKFNALINSATKEQVEKIHFVLTFIDTASKEETNELREQMKNEGFNVTAWIESKRPLVLEVV